MSVHESGKIAICRTDSGYLVRVTPRGTVEQSLAVRDFVCRTMDEGIHIVLDLSTCEYLDSTFLGSLVIMHQHGDESPGSLNVYADEARRHQLFGACHLDAFLNFASARPRCTSGEVALQVANLGRADLCEHLIATHQKLADLGGPAAETFRRIANRLVSERDRSQP